MNSGRSCLLSLGLLWGQFTLAADIDLVSPDDGERDVSTSATLEVEVSAGTSRLREVVFYGQRVGSRPRSESSEEFTVIGLPDTQRYAKFFPDIFRAQTRWIAANVERRNIVFVSHFGDVVEDADSRSQWIIADREMGRLDDVVPYGVLPGNHDMPTQLYNEYFPPSRFSGESWYRGHFGSTNENNYQVITAGGMRFLFLHLQYLPPPDVVDWADAVIDAHRDHRVIMTTHLWVFHDGSLLRNERQLFDKLVKPHPNLHFVLCGHLTAEILRTDRVDGRNVYQMLADYQGNQNGGEGWLRILRFVPDDDEVIVQTYSPWLDQYQRDADSEFVLDYPMDSSSGRNGQRIARLRDVRSGSSVSVTWSDLERNTEYEWYVEITDDRGRVTEGPWWTFRTGEPRRNSPPTASDQTYTTLAGDLLEIRLDASDPDGDRLAVELLLPTVGGALEGEFPDFRYEPRDGFVGSDSFSYRVSDGEDLSEVATVFIEVLERPSPLVRAELLDEDVELAEEGGRRALAFVGSISATEAAGARLEWTRAVFRNVGRGDASELVLAASLYLDANDDGILDDDDALVAADEVFAADSGGLVFDELGVALIEDVNYFVVLDLAVSSESRAAAIVSSRELAPIFLLACALLLLSSLRARRLRCVRGGALSIGLICLGLCVHSGCGGGGGGGSPGASFGPTRSSRELQIELIEVEVRERATGTTLDVDGLPVASGAFDA